MFLTLQIRRPLSHGDDEPAGIAFGRDGRRKAREQAQKNQEWVAGFQ